MVAHLQKSVAVAEKARAAADAQHARGRQRLVAENRQLLRAANEARAELGVERAARAEAEARAAEARREHAALRWQRTRPERAGTGRMRRRRPAEEAKDGARGSRETGEAAWSVNARAGSSIHPVTLRPRPPSSRTLR
jgi:hypothetical protein